MENNSPPSQPNEPAVDYSGYYVRSGRNLGPSSAKLQALADGYFGLNMVFLLNVILAIGLNVLNGLADTEEGLLIFVLAGVVAMLVIIFLATLPQNRKIAFGMGWGTAAPYIASGLMALNSALCCGIIGYAVMQHFAFNEMRKYGVQKGSLFGIRKVDVQARIAQMEAEGASPNPRPPSFSI